MAADQCAAAVACAACYPDSTCLGAAGAASLGESAAETPAPTPATPAPTPAPAAETPAPTPAPATPEEAPAGDADDADDEPDCGDACDGVPTDCASMETMLEGCANPCTVDGVPPSCEEARWRLAALSLSFRWWEFAPQRSDVASHRSRLFLALLLCPRPPVLFRVPLSMAVLGNSSPRAAFCLFSSFFNQAAGAADVMAMFETLNCDFEMPSTIASTAGADVAADAATPAADDDGPGQRAACVSVGCGGPLGVGQSRGIVGERGDLVTGL